ncbi:hypothetical protein NKH77_01930 [Streptomyces sp. M19]
MVGLKPSRGRTSLGPQHGEYWGPFTHEHVLTRSVRDTAAVLDVTRGAAPATRTPPHRRCGPTARRSAPTPARCASGYAPRLRGAGPGPRGVRGRGRARRAAAGILGHHVEPEAAPALDSPELFETLPPVFAAILAWELDAWSERLGSGWTRPTWNR